MQLIELSQGAVATRRIGAGDDGGPLLLMAHGWGHTHEAMVPIAEALKAKAPSVLLDFPGFGRSPRPPVAWGTEDYADHLAEWLRTMPGRCKVWVGHSFGCRVGVQLAARHPDLLQGMVLMSAAGLRRRRTLAQRLRLQARSRFFKLAMRFVRNEESAERWRQKFGSRDYVLAGAMRPTFVKVVSEDLAGVATTIRCPVLLLYGEADQETPPSMGEDYRRLIPNAELQVLRGFDHYSILDSGRHQIAYLTSAFVDRVC